VQSYFVVARKERAAELAELHLKDTKWVFTLEDGTKVKAKDCESIFFAIGRWSLRVSIVFVAGEEEHRIPVVDYNAFIEEARKARR
jgi:hypothetical protein